MEKAMRRTLDLDALRENAAEAAAMLRMLSHEARLAVLCELVNGERSAGALVETSGISQSALSQHLAKLREEGLVATRREAQSIHYRLADPKAARIIALLHDLYCKGKRT
jgi:DNA-binding transcriptional ArsR family regulator